ncbi:MAG TPA: glucuronate isomerase [Anaerolinea sp.]|nr:glucuronate isomerase [Anaerolinea sp.]
MLALEPASAAATKAESFEEGFLVAYPDPDVAAAEFGDDPRFALILFTLDETAYARELAPLAGVYPAVRLGPPWWFHDSWNGMRRYFDQVIETAGIHNTAGFNDDTRAFLSIPARHDLWRRACANWLAGLVGRGMLGREEAAEMALDLAYRLPKLAYRL